MLIVLFVAPLTAYLPLPAMGGIILLVAYNLIDFHHIKTILKSSRIETTVLLVTFFATLFLELEVAIYVGVFFRNQILQYWPLTLTTTADALQIWCANHPCHNAPNSLSCGLMARCTTEL